MKHWITSWIFGSVIAGGMAVPWYFTNAQQPVSTDYLFGGGDVATEDLRAATGLGSSDPREIIARVINITLGFLGVIALGLVVGGGFLWMTANGDEGKIETAKKLLISGAIGLLIILSAFGIARFVISATLGATSGETALVPSPDNSGNGKDNGTVAPGVTPTALNGLSSLNDDGFDINADDLSTLSQGNTSQAVLDIFVEE